MRKKKSKFGSNNAITKCRKEKNKIAIREWNPAIDERPVRDCISVTLSKHFGHLWGM